MVIVYFGDFLVVRCNCLGVYKVLWVDFKNIMLGEIGTK